MDKLRAYALHPIGRADPEDMVLDGIYLARLALERSDSIAIANFPYLMPAVILDRILDERGMEAVKNVILHELDVAEKREGPSIKGEYRENILLYTNICKKAKQVGISINSIEKETGLSIGSICKWNTVSPTVKNLSKVANVLGCTVDELLREEPEDTESEVG